MVGTVPEDVAKPENMVLTEEDRREIQAHTDEQDEYLDRVGQAVSTLHYMSQVRWAPAGHWHCCVIAYM